MQIDPKRPSTMPRIVLTDMPPPSSSDAHSEVDVLFICKGRAAAKILEIQNSAVSRVCTGRTGGSFINV